MPPSLPETDLKPFAERVAAHQAGPVRVLALPSPVPSVVSWRGSFVTNPDFAEGDELIQDLTVALLDKGTRRLDRFAIAEVLENRGAQLQFAADGLRVDISGRALTEDVPDVLRILAEQLIEPLFDPDEFEKARSQHAAMLHRMMESTAIQAAGALSRTLYGPAHPNHAPPPEALLERLAALTVEDIRAYHARHFGPRDMVLAFAGDLDADALAGVVRDTLGAWPMSEAAPRLVREALPPAPGRTEIPLPDKENVDVRMGHALPVRRDADEYMPLTLANYVLGGNFSARLMSVIRDEMGLTYGIRSSLSGVTTEHDGHWQVGVTLSHENVERGIAATLAEVARFVEHGITADELEEKQTTVTGMYKVGLATTGGLAGSLLRNAERGFDIAYLDHFPDLVRAVTLDQANAVIRTYFHPERYHIALAGTDAAR